MLKDQLIRLGYTKKHLRPHIAPVLDALSKTAGPGAGVLFKFEDAQISGDDVGHYSAQGIMKVRQIGRDQYGPIYEWNDHRLEDRIRFLARHDGFARNKVLVEDLRIESAYDSAQVRNAGTLSDIELDWSAIRDEIEHLERGEEDWKIADLEVSLYSFDGNLVYGPGSSRWSLKTNDVLEVEGIAIVSCNMEEIFISDFEVEFKANFHPSEELVYAYAGLDSYDDEDNW